MDKRFLEDCLAKGMSLPQIGRLVDRDPTTVGYWVKKHGLEANGHELHAPKGKVDPVQLTRLVERDALIREMSEELGAGYSTVRYWLKQFGLETERMKRRRAAAEARRLGLKRAYLRCSEHGHTVFFLRPGGGYRCAKCNQEGVVRWRRGVKQRLIDRAGGRCAICGYDRFQGALHFHHLDPSEKEFMLSRGGVTRSFAELQAEAEKCMLLCANCHSEVEAAFTELPPLPDKVVVP